MERILLCKPRMCGRENDFIRAALAEDWAVPLGPDCTAFEHELEIFVGHNKRVAALVSGTAAVHLALVACGVGPGDEVMVQSFTFCASSHPVTYLGATPVVSDSGTLPEESSFFLSVGNPIAAVCIRTSTERPEALDKGDKIVTAGGIYGTIREVKDTYFIIEIDKDVRIRVDKGSVYPSAEEANQAAQNSDQQK